MRTLPSWRSSVASLFVVLALACGALAFSPAVAHAQGGGT
jgi:hypothetical protein